jgi:probable F420-dependent oxidoreductase
MDVGVVLQRGFAGSPSELTLAAEAAERLGYHSLWINDHITVPVEIQSRYPYTPDGRPTMRHDTPYSDALVTLGFLAAITTRVRLGTSVLPMITRDPLTLAKQAATVDRLSGGRLELGLGAGWLVEEAEAIGNPHDHRAQRLDEAIDIMRMAWSQSSFEHEGRFWQIRATGVHPQPVQGADVPIWIGGTSPAAFRTTASRAVGNLIWLPEPEQLRWLGGRLRELRSDLRVGASLRLEDPGVGERAQALREAGADLLLLISPPAAEQLVVELEQFATETAPTLSDQ